MKLPPGWEVAVYREAAIESWRGNPLIEALPSLRSREEIAKLLASYPAFFRHLHDALEVRLHAANQVESVFIPLEVHFELEERISEMFRQGYIARNPARIGYWADAHARANALVQNSRYSGETSGSGLLLIGLPALGKTTTIKRIFSSLYPEVIVHTSYHGQRFMKLQIPAVFLQIPGDTSVKQLVISFFREVDRIVDTNYYEDLAKSGMATLDQMISGVEIVVAAHGIGLIVLDELQNIQPSRSQNELKMLNFFVQITNTIGVPLVLVGTYECIPIVCGGFRLLRRMNGKGTILWDRMVWGEDWEFFVQSLLDYQCVQKPIDYSEEISAVLYDATQGIHFYVISVFAKAQKLAIKSGLETITPAIIRESAKATLGFALPVINALRTGKWNATGRMRDVFPPDLDSLFDPDAPQSNSERSVKNEMSARQAQPPRELLERAEGVSLPGRQQKQPKAGDTDNKKATKPLDRAVEKSPMPARPTSPIPPKKGSMLEAFDAGQKQKIWPYEALRRAGFIRSPVEYLMGDQVLPSTAS